MARDGRKTVTVDEELADELEQYGDTRNEQVATVLELAESVQGTGRTSDTVNQRIDELEETLLDEMPAETGESVSAEPRGDTNIEEVHETLMELHEKLDRLPDRIVSALR